MKEYDLSTILFSLSGNQINAGTLEYYMKKEQLLMPSSDKDIFNFPSSNVHYFKTKVIISKDPDSPYMLLNQLFNLQQNQEKVITPLIFNDYHSINNILLIDAIFTLKSENPDGTATFSILSAELPNKKIMKQLIQK